jgi:hypothetical protein
MSKARGTAVKVFDKETGVISTFSSNRKAAEAIGCNETTTRRYIKSQKLYKGRYLFAKP